MLLHWIVVFVLGTGFLFAQEPGADLVSGLDGPQPGDRLRTAERIAALGPGLEDWLEKRVGKGSALHQRGVLLTAALLGTPAAHELIADAARAGRRPDAQRAWALLLYGMNHPEAGRDPGRDWKRASSEFEGACLLAGYLAHPRLVPIDELRKAVGKKPSSRQKALLSMLEARSGQAVSLDPEEPAQAAALLLASVVPGQEAIPATELSTWGAGLPPAWQDAALRKPGRQLAQLRGLNLRADQVGAVFALREIPDSEREAVVAFLAERVLSEPSASWLWGLAGELGLGFPSRDGQAVASFEASGLVRLAQLDLPRARALAGQRADRAREQLKELPRERDAAALAPIVVLAIAGRDADRDWFQAALAEASPELRALLQPLWLLAAGQFGDDRAREALLASWALRLGAGTTGYLDQAGRRFTALLLLGGTEAAEESLELREFADAFPLEHDHPITDEFYLDLAELLRSPHYRWRFEL